MIINHNIYGKVNVDDPVLIALIKSKPLQRLKGINQAVTQNVETELVGMTRYNHCIGAMLLLRRYNASLEEQISGLLHDIPHTAFSHMIDFALGTTEKQTFHEDHKERVVMESKIPKILAKYKINLRKVIDEKNFPLQEREIPALCADRIDYFFMELIVRQKNEKGFHTPSHFLKHIKVSRNEFVLDGKVVAQQFAREFMQKCLTRWNGPRALVAFSLLAEAIKIAMDQADITEKDIFQDDKYVYDKLKKIKNKKIQKNLSLLNPKIKLTEDEKDYDYHARGKARYVDPKILVNDRKIRLSTLEPRFKDEIKKFKKIIRKGRKIKITNKLDLFLI